jgi:hypothetical protein
MPPGPGGRQADAEPAGPLGVAAGHEGGGLLVLDEQEPDAVLVTAQPFHDPVDAVAGQPEHDLNAPVLQNLNQNVSSRLSHGAPSSAVQVQVPRPATLVVT